MVYFEPMFGCLFQIFKLFFVLTVPFLTLIRGSVYCHTALDWSPWMSIMGGIGMTSLVLMIYFTALFGRIAGRVGSAKSLKNRWIFILILLIGFSAHGLFFLSSENVKQSDVKDEYVSLHPLLRNAVSTLIWFDKDLVMTDAKRAPEDYKRMGLKTAKHSLHYPQEDGYVYAMDLRTNYRSELRNNLTQTYFQIMGFNTLRHGGTADHLHISLPCKYKPGGI